MNHLECDMVSSGRGLQNWSVAGYSFLPHLAVGENLMARGMDRWWYEGGNGARGNT